MQEIAQLASQGWVAAYTDVSAKTVRGWAQAGYRVFNATSSPQNFEAFVLETEHQSESRGELRAVLHALLHRWPGERLLVVMNFEYIFEGNTEWSVKWRRHTWRTASGEVGHRDLWEHILWERERGGEQVQLRWIPPHLMCQGIMGRMRERRRAGSSTPIIIERCQRGDDYNSGTS